MTQTRQASPKFYRIVAAVFLCIGGVLIWQAARRHEWFFWVIGMLTVANGLMSAIKSLLLPEK